MPTEVEIKAWVDDIEALRLRVADRYPHAGSYVKEDVYYRLSSGAGAKGEAAERKVASARIGVGSGAPSAEQVEFRLRVEGDRSYVTAKRKSLVEGVEVNDEMEYRVSDPRSFERFAEYLGASVFARKRKSGDRYRAGEATIELSHVDRLGDFIEIERLVERAEEIEGANREVRSLMRELSVPEERIEPRYYIDMLADRSESGA